MARTIITLRADGSEGAPGLVPTSDAAQGPINDAITAALAAAGSSHDSTTEITAIQTAVAAALASPPAIVIEFDSSITRHQLTAALKDHL